MKIWKYCNELRRVLIETKKCIYESDYRRRNLEAASAFLLSHHAGNTFSTAL